MEKEGNSGASKLWSRIFWISKSAAACIGLVVLSALLWFNSAQWTRFFLNSEVMSVLHKQPPFSMQYEKCAGVLSSKTQHFEFNVTALDTTAHQWRFLDSALSESRKNLRGMVKVDRGDFFQISDIDVRVVISSTNAGDLDSVLLNQSESILGLDYIFTDEKDMCTDVQVLVYLRPWPRRVLELFELRSEILDIFVDGSLGWEVNNLVTHTSHGETLVQGVRFFEPLITHNVSSSSISGEITGYYTANGRLEVHSERGYIYAYLMPRYDGSSFDPESILVSNVLGDIHVETSLEYWTSHPLNHTTNIHTVAGKLWAAIPHGSLTNLSSSRGDITAYVIPFGVPSLEDQSALYTRSLKGKTFVSLYNAPLDSLEGYHDPLLNMTSEHQVGEGKLEVWYPYSWYGSMEAQIGHGPIKFESSALEDFEHGKGFVKARRGKAGESEMEARVGSGEMVISLGF